MEEVGVEACVCGGGAAFVTELYAARSHKDGPRPRASALLGGGMRFAFVVEFALWLQSLRILTAAYLVFILAGVLFVEIMFRYAGSDRRGHRWTEPFRGGPGT